MRKHWRSYRLAIITAGLLMLSGCGEQPAPEDAVVENGRLRGVVEDEVVSFKGIPFAGPPVGELRWRAPQPAADWEGVRDATAFGPDCMQIPFPSDAAPLGVEPARFVARTLAERGQPVYHFRFAYVADSLRGELDGAPHATEIPFVFNRDAPRTERRAEPLALGWRLRQPLCMKNIDVLGEQLRVLFVGFNPSPRSESSGHPYAGRGNHFWRLLAAAGLTPFKLKATDSARLPEWGLGSTNLVARPTATAAELSRAELRAGLPRLQRIVAATQPRVIAYTGKGVYLAAAGLGSAPWGEQPGRLFPGSIDFVLPSPSGLVRLSFAEKLAWYTALAECVGSLG